MESWASTAIGVNSEVKFSKVLSMLRKLCSMVLPLPLLCIPQPALGVPRPDDLSLKLSRRLTNYSLGVCNFIEALVRVSTEFQVPMGITWVNNPEALAQMPYAWKEETLKDIIQTIAERQPGYQVQIANGVVHISSPGMVPDQQNFLKLKIGGFEVHNQVEVASWELRMLITPRRYGAISIGATGDSRVDLNLKDTTVEGVLDALAATSKRQIWIVTFANDTRLTQTGFRRTISLWNQNLGPDDEQPCWDLLRWGNPLPPLVSGTPTPPAT